MLKRIFVGFLVVLGAIVVLVVLLVIVGSCTGPSVEIPSASPTTVPMRPSVPTATVPLPTEQVTATPTSTLTPTSAPTPISPTPIQESTTLVVPTMDPTPTLTVALLTPTVAFPTIPPTPIPTVSIPTVVPPTSTPVPTVVPTPPPNYSAIDIFREYKANTTRANDVFTNTYVAVSVSDISNIEADGKVVLEVDKFNFEEIQMHFADPAQVIPLNPGDSVQAICVVGGLYDPYGMGMGFGFQIVFRECQMVAINQDR